MIILILAFIILSSLMILLLWISNSKKENRWKQFFNVPLLLLIDIIGIFTYGKIQELTNLVLQAKTLEFFASYNYYITFFLVVLLSALLFVLLKPIIRFITPKLKLFPFYRVVNAKMRLYYLKDNYVFLNMILKFLAISILALYFLALSIYYFFPNISPFYILMVCFLILESYWYFNGNFYDEKDNNDEDTPVDEIFEKNDVEFEKIYNFFINDTSIFDANKLISYQKIRNKKSKEEENTRKLKTKVKNKSKEETFDNGDYIIKVGNYSLIPDNAIKKIRNLILGGRKILLIGPYWNIVFLNNQNQGENNPYYNELYNFFSSEVLGGMEIFNGISDIQFFSSKHHSEALTKSIVISSAFDILYDSSIINNNINWFDKLDLVIFENISENFVLNRTAQATLSNVLRSIKKNINYWFLNSETQNLEPAIRNEFFHEANITELTFMGSKDNLAYYLCWRNENKTLQDIFDLPINQHIGVNYVVSHKSNELVAHKKFEFITDNNEPKNDYWEALLKLYAGNNLSAPTFTHSLNQFVLDKEKPFYLIDDYNYNVSNLIARLKTSKSKTVLYSISSKPYLFRDYMLGNLGYFSKHVMLPLSPKIDVTDIRNKLIVLFETLKYRTLPKEDIEQLLNLEINEKDIYFPNYLCELYKYYFESDIKAILKVNISKDPFKQWKPVINYYIDGNENINGHLVNFNINENERDDIFFGKMQRDFIFQYFLSKPYFAYNQKYFKISDGGIDIKNKSISLEHLQEDTTNRWHTSRSVYEVNLSRLAGISKPKLRDGINSVLCFVSTDIQLKILGRYDFLGNIPFDYYSATYIDAEHFNNLLRNKDAFEEISRRTHKNKRSFYFSVEIGSFINKTDNRNLTISKIGHTLTFLIQQALVSFLPDSFEFLKVICLNKAKQGFKDQKLVNIVNVSEGIGTDKEWVQILFIEDAISDLGLLNSIKECLLEKILAYIDDYLHWYIFTNDEVNTPSILKSSLDIDIEVEEGNIEGPGNTGPFLNISQPFLRCVQNNHPDFLDLKNTKMILSKILKENNITESRLKYLVVNEDISDDDNADHECDFCRSVYKGNEMEVIKADGRERCPICSEQGVDEEKEVKKLIAEDTETFFKHLNLIMPKSNLKVRFTNTIEIQKRFGKTFRPTRFFDWRILGFASTEGLIQIENMMPQKNYILTIIHEWVHIWQYRNLDYMRMGKYDKLLIEGHTTWSEIYYAKHIAEWDGDWEDRIAPATRNDEYGDGYRLIVELLEKHKKFNNDPFKMLLEFYPG